MNSTKSNKGFTIIEVVLVLAIAGLIFLMVFLALPALQRNQRDTQRRSDLSRLAAAVTTYKSNSNGRLPFVDTTPADGIIEGYQPNFVTQYLTTGATFEDPSTPGTGYALNTAAGGTTVSQTQQIKIYRTSGTDCTAAAGQAVVATGSVYVLRMFQENGGSTCQTL